MSDTRKTQRPNWERDPTGLPAIQLQDRDRELIEIVFAYRVLTSDDAVTAYRLRHPDKPTAGEKLGNYTAPVASARTIKRRLRYLYHWGYLTRPQENVVLRARQGRSLPMVYRIGEAAVPVLCERGYDVDHVRGALGEPSFRYLEHTLLVTEFRLALEQALQEQSQWQLLFWQNEGGATRTAWHSKEGGRNRRHSVNPDAYFALTDGERPMHFVMDVDRGTMSRRRMKAKFEALAALWREKRHAQPPYNMPDKTAFRALFPTITPERVETLRGIAREADPKGHGLNIFWFGDRASYAEEPQTILDPMWYLPSGETPHSLLDRKLKRPGS